MHDLDTKARLRWSEDIHAMSVAGCPLVVTRLSLGELSGGRRTRRFTSLPWRHVQERPELLPELRRPGGIMTAYVGAGWNERQAAILYLRH
ncbi:hypothetical protein [Rhodopila sp.]|uniref:hypothetical protein n=1 Tax=Rhodopila sp. TaxID=2480087 RepID=UPI003D14D841